MNASNFAMIEKIANGGTSKVSPSESGQYIYIVAITSVNGASQTITFEDDSDLNVLEVPKNSNMSFAAPIRCKSFTPSDADISVCYIQQ